MQRESKLHNNRMDDDLTTINIIPSNSVQPYVNRGKTKKQIKARKRAKLNKQNRNK